MATIAQQEILVSKAVERDRIDQHFQSLVNKARRSLKKAPGGRRAWVWYQASFGAYRPHRPIIEMLDMLIENNVAEEDIEPLAMFFCSYLHSRLAEREIKLPELRDALVLEATPDAESDIAEAETLRNTTIGNVELLIERETRCIRTKEKLVDSAKKWLAQAVLRGPESRQWT